MSRKTRENPAHEGEGLYRTLADAAQDIIYIIDRDDRVTFLNKYGLALLGKAGGDVIGRPRRDLFPPAEAERQYQGISRVFATGEPLRIESTVPLPGRMTWQDTLLVPIRSNGGEVSAVMGLSRDITARRQAETALKESEERYRAIFSSLEDLYYQTDKDGNITVLSPSVTRLTGFRPEELIGKPTTEVYASPQDREQFRATLFRQGYVRDFELRLLKRDGTVIPVSLTANLILDKNGEYTGVSGILRDITARNQAEERLRSSEQKFSTLFAANPVALTLVSPENGTFVDVNEAFVRHTGFSRDEVIGKTAAELGIFPDPAAYAAMTDRLRKDHTLSGWQIQTRDKAGRIYTSQFTSQVVLMEGRPHILSAIEDISERTRAQDALRESERNYREIFNSTSEAIMIDDAATGRIIDVNETTLRMYGYDSREELLAGTIGDLSANIPPFDEQAAQARIRRCIEQGPQVFEWLAKKKSGEVFRVEVSLRKTEVGGKGRVLAVVRDISERTKALDALRESETLLREIVSNANDAVFLLERTPAGPGRYILVNEKAVRMLQYSREELLQISPREIVPADVAEQVMPGVIARLQREGHATFESVHRRKDGTTYPVEVSTHTFRYRGADVDLSICRDITGRRQAEQVLRESEERYRALVDHALEAILIFDFSGSILFANHAAAVLGDVPDPASLHGRNVMEFIAPDSREAVLADFAAVQNGEDAYLTQYKVLTTKGRELWVESMGKRIRYNGQWADIVMLRNITERKVAEDALRIANRKLTLLTGITRHDIRNQLLSLHAYLVLSKDSVQDPGRMAEFIRIEEEIVRNIEQQVQFTREYEKLGINAPEWQNVRQAIGRAAQTLDLTGIDLDLSRLQDIEIYADGLLANVLLNLLDNSLRHGGESLHTVRFASGETGRGLLITCGDDGAGVPPGDRELIFERGYGKNTGFGLFFIREILAITGITITETGEPGQGARFEILVPRGGYRFRKDRVDPT